MMKEITNKESEYIVEEYIMSLITRMTVKEEFRTSQESVRWHAHREAETVTDPDLLFYHTKIITSTNHMAPVSAEEIISFFQ